MKISTKGRYGLKILLELALQYNKKLVTVREISERQQISEKYIEQIMGTLNKSGLVRSYRGAFGGYKLSNDPFNVAVGDVLRITEGGLNIVDDTDDDNKAMRECVTNDVWIAIREAVESVVDNISLQDLVDKHNENANFSYSI